MIVKKYWTSGNYKKRNYRDWCGWFLLGFIPMYVYEIPRH